MRWGLDTVTVRLTKRIALTGVSVPANPSEVTVVVGGDGAGKTTSMRTLVGLVQPEGGTVERPSKEAIGYVPATAGLYPDLSAEENLAFAARAYGASAGGRAGLVANMLSKVGLRGAERRLAGQLSGGMKRKLALAMALIHSPELVVLDEPTTGVDPLSRVELWGLISEAAANGAAVVVATTYLNEATRATLAVVLGGGRVLASGPPEELVGKIPGAVGSIRGDTQPTPLSWRRGAAWRVWAPSGDLPGGAEAVNADFEDAAVVASLAAGESE